MTEKKKYIKAAFKNYNDNKQRLRSLSYEGLHGIDYAKPIRSKGVKSGQEKALVSYLDNKRDLEKQVELVDRVIWFYRLEGLGKDEYITQRYLKGHFLYRVAMDINVSEGTLHSWERDIRETAERCADLYNLW